MLEWRSVDLYLRVISNSTTAAASVQELLPHTTPPLALICATSSHTAGEDTSGGRRSSAGAFACSWFPGHIYLNAFLSVKLFKKRYSQLSIILVYKPALRHELHVYLKSPYELELQLDITKYLHWKHLFKVFFKCSTQGKRLFNLQVTSFLRTICSWHRCHPEYALRKCRHRDENGVTR